MEKILLAIAAIALLGSVFILNNTTSIHSQDVLAKFQAFKNKFNKKYGAEESNYRMQVFAQNLEQISTFNSIKGEQMMGVTLFSDLTDEEFAATYLTKLQHHTDSIVSRSFSTINAPETLDWRTKGAVTPIKNQGQCGSCWAFSTTGVLEGFFQQTKGTLPSLSEQQLVDCSGLIYGNLGCQGGMPSRALNYVKSHGITTDDVYTYTAVKGKCQTQGGAYKVAGHTAVDASDDGLIGAIQNHPVSVAVDATNWKNYVSGIFDDCDSKMNHAVLAVGYGVDHYIVKNSWTAQWGDAGYIKLARANTCGIHNTMVIPKN